MSKTNTASRELEYTGQIVSRSEGGKYMTTGYIRLVVAIENPPKIAVVGSVSAFDTLVSASESHQTIGRHTKMRVTNEQRLIPGVRLITTVTQ